MLILFYYWKETPESVRKLYVSPHGTFLTHIKGNFDLSEILEKTCSHFKIIKLSSSFIFRRDVPPHLPHPTPLKDLQWYLQRAFVLDLTQEQPTNYTPWRTVGKSHQEGQVLGQGKRGLGGGGVRCRDKVIDASGGHDPEQPTLLYPEPQTSLFPDRFSTEFWMSTKILQISHQKPATRKKYSRCFDSIYF